jgi:hypothetical protein
VRFTGWYSRNLAGAETIIPMNEALTVGQAG